MYLEPRKGGTFPQSSLSAKLGHQPRDSGDGMRVEWTSYSSPIGALTIVECEAGPLVIEYPNRAVTIKWAVRLRAAVPELHIAQGTCRLTTTWLDEYFNGSPPALPFPAYL